MPSAWDEVEVERVFRGVKYLIQIRKGDKKGLFVDGEKVTGDIIPTFEKNTTHTVEYFI